MLKPTHSMHSATKGRIDSEWLAIMVMQLEDMADVWYQTLVELLSLSQYPLQSE